MSERGRGNQNYGSIRGRSGSRGRFNRGRPRGGRNFFDQDVANEEAKKIEVKQEQIKAKKEEEPKPVDKEKKETLIEKGKQWFNKYWGGVKKKDGRTNIIVTLNNRLDEEIYAAYETKLFHLNSNSFYWNAEDIKSLPYAFKAFINYLIALKLIRANRGDEKLLVSKFNFLLQSDIKVPKMLGVIIDCLGKTDASGDNVIKLSGSNSLIKSHLMKCILEASVAIGGNFFVNLDTSKFNESKLQQFYDRYVVARSEKSYNDWCFYSADRSGITDINNQARYFIDKVNNQNFVVKMGESEISLRLPYFDPKNMNDINKILEWEKSVSVLFTAIKYDPKSYRKAIALVLMSWLPLRFIKNRSRKFKEIDDLFDGTIFAEVTAREVLEEHDYFCVEDIFDDDELYGNIVYFVEVWKTRFQPILEDTFNLVKFNPSEYGTSSQLITNHGLRDYHLENINYKQPVKIVKNCDGTESFIKMNEEEAIIGSAFKFSNFVEFQSSYKYNILGNGMEIRNSIISGDLKK